MKFSCSRGVSLDIFSIGFILILCSKFYYAFGSQGINPIVPVYVILIRDVIIWSFLLYFGIKHRKYIFEVKFFWYFWGIAFLISIAQFWIAKDFQTWAQHYFRNVLSYLLIYPVVYASFRAGEKLDLKRVLTTVFIIDLAVSYFQLLSSNFHGRPLGIFGEPIVNSTFLYIGLCSLFFSRQLVWGVIAVMVVAPLLYFAASLTALFSFMLGMAMMVFVKSTLRGRVVWCFVAVTLMLSSYFIVGSLKSHLNSSSVSNFDGITGKLFLLYDNLTCDTPWCHSRSWSLEGRVQSNYAPIKLCQSSVVNCLFGNFDTANYERVESTWGSLVINWGLIVCIAFFMWLFLDLRILFSDAIRKHDVDSMYVMLSVTLLVFLAVNVIIYRLPLNFLLYVCLAFFHYFRFQNESQKS